jgi:polar amino acid transport system substrate-binding protein
MKYLIFGLILLLKCNLGFANDSIFIIGDEDNKPECYINAAGEFVGTDVDIIREIFRRLRIDVKIELAPWVRVLSMVKSGQADAGFPLFLAAEREEYAYYTQEPLHISVMTVYTKSGREFVYNNFKDLFHKRVGINRGYSISKEFDDATAEGLISLVEVDSIKQLVKMLVDERIDAVAATPSSINSYLRETNIDISAIGQVQERSAYLTLSKKADIKNKEELLHNINNTLLEMRNDGSIKRIRSQYLD